MGILFEVYPGAIKSTKGKELTGLILGRLPLLHWFLNQEKELYLPVGYKLSRKVKRAVERVGIVVRSTEEV